MAGKILQYAISAIECLPLPCEPISRKERRASGVPLHKNTFDRGENRSDSLSESHNSSVDPRRCLRDDSQSSPPPFRLIPARAAALGNLEDRKQMRRRQRPPS